MLIITKNAGDAAFMDLRASVVEKIPIPTEQTGKDQNTRKDRNTVNSRGT